MVEVAPREAWAGTTAISLAVVLWGLGNVLVKHLGLDGMSLALDRLWLGAAAYTSVFVLRGGRLTWRALRLALLGGMSFAGDLALFFVALRHTSVADATIIGALQPALVLVIAGPLFGELVTLAEVALSAVGILGVTIAVLGSSATAGRTLFGDLLAVGALVAFTWYFVASKQARAQLGAFEYQTCLLIVAAVVLTPVVALSGHALVLPRASDIGWAGLMALIPGSGHLLVNWAHRSVPIMVTSLLTLATPVVSIAGAGVLLGEPLTLVQVGGILIALLGVGLVLLRAATTAEPATP